MLAASTKPNCMQTSPKLPVKVMILPGRPFPMRAVRPEKINQPETVVMSPVASTLPAIPTIRDPNAKIMAGITYLNFSLMYPNLTRSLSSASGGESSQVVSLIPLVFTKSVRSTTPYFRYAWLVFW